MKLKEAVIKACEFDDLRDALISIALWETERIVEQAVRNTKEQKRNPDGSLYETMWGLCFDEVLSEFPKAELRRKDALVKLHLSNVIGVDGIYRHDSDKDNYYLVVKEHGLYKDFTKAILSVEDIIDVHISVRAHQGRDIPSMFTGANEIWLRGKE